MADLDLGDGRRVKIYTGWADTTLPIFAELFVAGKSVDTKVIEYYGGPLDATVLSRYKYDVITNESKQVLVVIQTDPEKKTRPVIAMDFVEGFGFPVCPQEKCRDCHGGSCEGNNQACFAKFNQILDVIENGNPGIGLERIKWMTPLFRVVQKNSDAGLILKWLFN